MTFRLHLLTGENNTEADGVADGVADGAADGADEDSADESYVVAVDDGADENVANEGVYDNTCDDCALDLLVSSGS